MKVSALSFGASSLGGVFRLVKEAEAKDVAEDAQHGADLMW